MVEQMDDEMVAWTAGLLEFSSVGLMDFFLVAETEIYSVVLKVAGMVQFSVFLKVYYTAEYLGHLTAAEMERG